MPVYEVNVLHIDPPATKTARILITPISLKDTMKVTTKKKNANRRNARRSTGPKSKSGKSAVALNGMVHGLRSTKPVLPGLEKEEDWEAHKNAIIAQLAPEGAIEQALADRTALGFWRLARCASAESRVLETYREHYRNVALSNKMYFEKLRKDGEPKETALARLDQECEILTEFSVIWNAVEAGKSRLKVEIKKGEALLWKSVPSNDWDKHFEEFNETGLWPSKSVGKLRSIIEWFAERIASEPVAWIKREAAAARAEVQAMRAVLNRLMLESEMAAEMDLIENDVTSNLIRYETSIHRALHRDMHELQRIQAMRLGLKDAIPAAIDVTTDG